MPDPLPSPVASDFTGECHFSVTVRGVVQGVGFRPFVYNAARTRGLVGWVLNEAGSVEIELWGGRAAAESFLSTLRHEAPRQSRIDGVVVTEKPVGDRPASFEIRTSAAGVAPQPTIPTDLATCPECRAEIVDSTQRRYHYPFTNCTQCGPRWSIIREVPYDRPRTSMAEFVMCEDCRAEYTDPTDRRFHAQPIACPVCGPVLELLDAAGATVASGDEAMQAAVEAILAGKTVALKGLGGFQLLCDATSQAAVQQLRRRKRRPDRPFAVMLGSLDAVRQYCQLSDGEAALLASPQAPIVLVRRHSEESSNARDLAEGDSPIFAETKIGTVPNASTLPLADAIAPGNPWLGVMLPYTPLHHLLMEAIDRPIVCTSGNLAEEPMATTIEDALRSLGEPSSAQPSVSTTVQRPEPIADLFLTHNRPIVRPVDDSVTRVGSEGIEVLRRARGYAPLPISIDLPSPTVLAVGGHLKNTVALALGNLAGDGRIGQTAGKTPVVLSPHIGDLESLASVEVFQRTIDDLLRFFQVEPGRIACDLHPDYASTRHAEALGQRWGVPLVRVQHHHAHVAACMAEWGLRGPVLGLAWDGTGYGEDGTVWGGEALRCQGAVCHRVSHLRTFSLPGGDRAMREPRRSALGLLFEILSDQTARWLAADSVARNWFSDAELATLTAMLTRGFRTARTSSMGRLFDAVAALCGLPPVISFEGQAAMSLEFAASAEVHDAYPLPLTDEIADWEPMVRAILEDRGRGVPVATISARFHNALAQLAVETARRGDCQTVVLSGGCFQNALLRERVRAKLTEAGFQVFSHRQIPPGDGGIALGQIFVAAQQTPG